MTPRPELRPEVERVLARYTGRAGAVHVVGLADELADLQETVRGLERQWAALVQPAALEAAAKAHYQMASAFSWERLSAAEQALAITAALAAVVAARKAAKGATAAPVEEGPDAA